MNTRNPLQKDADLRHMLIPPRSFDVSEPPCFATRLLRDDAVRHERLFTAYTLFADLLNLQRHDERDRKGIWHSIDGLRELLDVGCEVADINPFDKELWLRALDEFREDLLRHDGQAMHRRPAQKNRNFIAFFLEETRHHVKAVADPENAPNRWRQLLIAGYYATRLAVDDHATRDAVKQWGRADLAHRSVE